MFFFIKLNLKIQVRRSRLALCTVEDIMLICENSKFEMCSNDVDDYDSDYEDYINDYFYLALNLNFI